MSSSEWVKTFRASRRLGGRGQVVFGKSVGKLARSDRDPRRAVGEGPERVESILLLRVVDSEYLFGVVRIAAKKRGPGKMPGPEF